MQMPLKDGNFVNCEICQTLFLLLFTKYKQGYYTVCIMFTMFKIVQNSVQTVYNSMQNRAFELKLMPFYMFKTFFYNFFCIHKVIPILHIILFGVKQIQNFAHNFVTIIQAHFLPFLRLFSICEVT